MKLFEWKKESSWPNYLGKENIDIEDSVPLDLLDIFKKDYSHVRTYHACRPINIDSYLKKGICILNLETLERDFICNIRKYCNIEISREEVSLAHIPLLDLESSRRYVYVALDDTCLLCNKADHYISYGSEYLTALAQNLCRTTGKVSKENLKQYGIPTILVVNLNLNKVGVYDFKDLVREVNNAIFHGEKSNSTCFSFALTKNIKPREIVAVYYPK